MQPSSKVYITRYKFNSIVRGYDLNQVSCKDEEIYLASLREILSVPELKLLALYRQVLVNPDVLSKIKKRYSDSRKYVYEAPPSYHRYIGCPKLSAEFDNYRIPEPVRNKGDAAVDKFRQLFHENKLLYQRDPAAFMARVEIALNVVIQGVDHEHYDNSGWNEINEMLTWSPQQIGGRINQLLDEMDQFRHSNSECEKEIKRSGYGSHKAQKRDANGQLIYLKDDPDSAIYRWHNDKQLLKALLKEYLRSSCNKEFSFDAGTLENLGFRACQTCQGYQTAAPLIAAPYQPVGSDHEWDDTPF